MKENQSIDNDAVLALSNSINLITDTMQHFREDFVKGRESNCSTIISSSVAVQTMVDNSEEANDSDALDVCVIEISNQSNQNNTDFMINSDNLQLATLQV